MAKSIYTGIGGIARNTKSIYVGVGGKARKVTKGYIGVGGVARQFYPGIVYTWKKYSSTKWDYVSNDEYDNKFRTYLITCYKNITLKYYRRTYESSIRFDSSTGTWDTSDEGITLSKTYNLTAGTEMSCNAYWGSILGLNGVDLTIVGNVPYYSNGTLKGYDIRIKVTGPNPNKNWALSMNGGYSARYVEEATLVADTSSYVGDVISSNPNAYPTNGKHTDGYWYIKQ